MGKFDQMPMDSVDNVEDDETKNSEAGWISPEGKETAEMMRPHLDAWENDNNMPLSTQVRTWAINKYNEAKKQDFKMGVGASDGEQQFESLAERRIREQKAKAREDSIIAECINWAMREMRNCTDRVAREENMKEVFRALQNKLNLLKKESVSMSKNEGLEACEKAAMMIENIKNEFAKPGDDKEELYNKIIVQATEFLGKVESRFIDRAA